MKLPDLTVNFEVIEILISLTVFSISDLYMALTSIKLLSEEFPDDISPKSGTII